METNRKLAVGAWSVALLLAFLMPVLAGYDKYIQMATKPRR